MWSRYDRAVVREELGVLAEHGLTVTRSFCYWPDFVPAVEQLDEDVVTRFADFLDAHLEFGLRTMPSLIVGHMSGENWDPPWRQGRDLYRDVWLVSQQAWFARELTARFGNHPAIAAWLISNEMPRYAGPATSEEVTAWARILVQAVRASGATQPVSLGDGVFGPEVSGCDNGYSLRALAPLVDFVGPHVYPAEDDEVRRSLSAAFACELAGGFGKPVVLEEFGVSSDLAADQDAAEYYRVVLPTTLLAGARGWLAWSNCDFDDLRNDDPYRHHVFEMHFGLTDRVARPKPQLHALAEFAELVHGLAADGWERAESDVALVVPEHFERALPFTAEEHRADIRDNLFQSYVAAREADLPLELQRERDGLTDTVRLYLAPCAKLLTAPGIDALRELARGGATVYVSYFAGSSQSQRGPWLSWLDEIFGVRHRLRHGLVDPIEDDEVVLEFVERFGEIEPGTKLAFPVAGEPSARSYLPLDPLVADVVAVDGYGRPALVRHALGRGWGVLCTYPIEHFAARRPRANPECTWRLYSALADFAGVSRPVRVADPRVLAGRLRTAESELFVFINSSSERVAVEPTLAEGVELPVPAGLLALEPYGVVALRGGVPAGAPVTAANERRDARI
jgi:endo-1,4-beta-mannosidase